MRIALCPLNPVVGDIAGNADLIADAVRSAEADLVVVPELALCGYPPRDLLLHRAFVADCERTAEALAARIANGPALLLGTPLPGRDASNLPTNSLLLLSNGRVMHRYDKRLLPNYEVFDEQRYFAPGRTPSRIEFRGATLGLAICEDLWRGVDAGNADRYAGLPDPLDELRGVDLLLAPSASPFVTGKHARHTDILAHAARRIGAPVLSINQLGANDDLIFDGAGCVVRSDGVAVMHNERFSGGTIVLDTAAIPDAPAAPEPDDDADSIIDALTLGTRDYLAKSGFTDACLGLSGGIDSAVTAAIAARAIGSDHLLGVAMPGKYSSDHALADARDLAERIGCRFAVAPIADPYDGFAAQLEALFDDIDQPALGERMPDLTEQNLQSRVRGATMMAISNRTGALLLTTGNKSELAVGYCTLYGDMNGGLAVLSDLLKHQVYAVARRLNEAPHRFGFDRPPIPESTISKEPSAELAPDQRDADTLPPYDELDTIVERHIDRRQSAETIAAETGIARETVDRMLRLMRINEYKRFQYAVGLKISPVAFGRGRRMPIVGRWN